MRRSLFAGAALRAELLAAAHELLDRVVARRHLLGAAIGNGKG